VALEGSAENSWPGFATGFMGDAMAPPGAPAPNWLGEPGKTPPGQRPPADGEPQPGQPVEPTPGPVEPEPEPPEEPQ
jgi:hypothetical protein